LYHWDVDQPDRVIEVGDEQVLHVEVGGAKLFFALGPPTPTAPPEERMRRVLELPEVEIAAIRWGEQVHGRVIASLASNHGRRFQGAACVGRCDALMSAESGIGLVVWSADCVPTLITGGDVVAAVHSGWRGTVADIAGAVVRRFAVEYGIEPENLHAALGPAISGARYEVSQSVIDSLGAFGLEEERWRSGNQVDLRQFLTARLEDLGLDPGAIRAIGPCTASTPELASYRRDGVDSGRQWSMVYRSSSSC
jgi:YfiH family protein